MRGYPKVIATKQDFENLLAEPENKKQALTDLQALYELQDDTLERVVSYDMDEKGQMINVVTETIPSPMPMYRRMGFESRDEILGLCDLLACKK